LPADENGDDVGYLVEYTDGGKPNTAQYAGYVSWSPKEQADNAYRETSGLPFGLAIEAMKQGFSIARSGWNGNRLASAFVPPTRSPVVYMGLCYILLSDGQVAFCDEADYELAAQQENWSVNNGYPYFTDYTNPDAPSTVKLHQLLNPEWGMTDHENGDRLDNRRSNMRECTSQQNNANRDGRKDSTSRFKGVSWDSSRDKWISSIQINRKTKHIGRFDGEEAAARAYDSFAFEAHGDFARLNFPKPRMFVYLVPANAYPAQTGAAKSYFGDGAMVPYNAYMAIKNVDETVSTWVPSVNDCLADDWSVVA
jgi:hypothetical protein